MPQAGTSRALGGRRAGRGRGGGGGTGSLGGAPAARSWQGRLAGSPDACSAPCTQPAPASCAFLTLCPGALWGFGCVLWLPPRWDTAPGHPLAPFPHHRAAPINQTSLCCTNPPPQHHPAGAPSTEPSSCRPPPPPRSAPLRRALLTPCSCRLRAGNRGQGTGAAGGGSSCSASPVSPEQGREGAPAPPAAGPGVRFLLKKRKNEKKQKSQAREPGVPALGSQRALGASGQNPSSVESSVPSYFLHPAN